MDFFYCIFSKPKTHMYQISIDFLKHDLTMLVFAELFLVSGFVHLFIYFFKIITLVFLRVMICKVDYPRRGRRKETGKKEEE